VTVTLGIYASERSSLPVIVGVLAVFSSVLTTRRRPIPCRFADLSSEWLFCGRGGDVTLGRRIVSQRSVVIAAIGCAIARVGGIIAPVSGPIACCVAACLLNVDQDGGPMYRMRECSLGKATAARLNGYVAHWAPRPAHDRYPHRPRTVVVA
jgi:hypothetical protein